MEVPKTMRKAKDWYMDRMGWIGRMGRIGRVGWIGRVG
jgi:hypothetical protein